jgi:parvulin-like peptidyl-prolyl isomerase
MMVPPFEEAAFAAKVNEVTEPVKTPFGYHVIKVESHVTKSLADARPDIEKKLRPEIARTSVENLRKDATVQMDDGFFGPAPAATPGLTPGAATPGAATPAPPAAK